MMSRTLSYAMPKKRQLGGIVGSTPQLSSPIPSVGGVTWMGNAPAPLSPLSQQIMGQSGNMQAAKQNIDRVRAEKGFPSLYNPLPPPMEEMPKKKKPDYSEYAHMEKGGYVKGPQPPHALARGGQAGGTNDFGPGKGLGVIGGGMQGPLREVVTGGYGAMPARAGRIGYRGTLQERPGSRPSGLAGFYAMQREANLGKANLTKIDPTTGLAFNPSEREISAQMKMVGEKYGPTETAMLGDYYNAGRTGDFARQQQAKDRIMARRQELQGGIASSKPQIPPMLKRPEYPSSMPDYFGNAMNAAKNLSSPMNLESGGYAKSSPIPVAPTNTGGRNPDGIPVKDAMAKLEHGGANEKVKPYIVNEKGEEAWQPDGEKPQLIPGKEKMVLFPKDGKVIPHGRTMEMAKKGKVEMPKHAFDGEPEAIGSKLSPAKRRELALSELAQEKKRQEQIDQARAKQQAAKETLEATGSPLDYYWNKYAPEVSGASPFEALLKIDPVHAGYKALQKKVTQMVSDLYPNADEATKARIEKQYQDQALKNLIAGEEGSSAIPSDISPEEEEAKLTYQDLVPEVAAPKAPQVPEMLKRPEPAIPDYLGNALAAAKDLPRTPSAPTPEQIKTQTGYTPEEMELLAQGQEMTSRGISQMGPSGVKFSSGGGIEGGKAFGPRVVDQQKPVTIRPGKIKDELGDVGTRLAKEKEDKEFMKRWESDLASGKAPETEKAFKKPMKLQRGGRTSGYAEKREDGGPVKSMDEIAPWNPQKSNPDKLGLGPAYTQANPYRKMKEMQLQQQVAAQQEAGLFGTPRGSSNLFVTPSAQPAMNALLPSFMQISKKGNPHLPLNYYETFANNPQAQEEAIQQQADMEKFAKEAMAARNARRGRTKSFTK